MLFRLQKESHIFAQKEQNARYQVVKHTKLPKIGHQVLEISDKKWKHLKANA